MAQVKGVRERLIQEVETMMVDRVIVHVRGHDPEVLTPLWPEEETQIHEAVAELLYAIRAALVVPWGSLSAEDKAYWYKLAEIWLQTKSMISVEAYARSYYSETGLRQ